MRESERSHFASSSVALHLMRGVLGFGLIGAALALTPSHGPAALLLAPVGAVALRGCPTCWIVGLVETISAGRVERTCDENGCALNRPKPTASDEETQPPGRQRGRHRTARQTKMTRPRAA
jgi:hypothetical protein